MGGYSREELLERLNDLNIELDELKEDYDFIKESRNELIKVCTELESGINDLENTKYTLIEKCNQLEKDNEFLINILKSVYETVKDFD